MNKNLIIPESVAIIMDGNGRWAELRGLPRIYGHREGVNAVKRAVTYAYKKGIKVLSFFAFSTENWKRPREEVMFLMNLFKEVIEKEFDEIVEKGIKVKFLSRKDELPEFVIKEIERVEENSKLNDKMTLLVALNYGGRFDIIQAVNKIIESGIKKVDEEEFEKYLLTYPYKDPDLLIRTSGELRISNFFLYQISYTELYFTEKLWPDFDDEDFEKALIEYSRRKRRFGGI
ncbi:MAG: di-trans,poly-cis-decaprenylcistransferase [Caldisericia bacterium]|nr:di-trans,poly-cis-decaprenylcistransferase [Caldisericia bacterium]